MEIKGKRLAFLETAAFGPSLKKDKDEEERIHSICIRTLPKLFTSSSLMQYAPMRQSSISI